MEARSRWYCSLPSIKPQAYFLYGKERKQFAGLAGRLFDQLPLEQHLPVPVIPMFASLHHAKLVSFLQLVQALPRQGFPLRQRFPWPRRTSTGFCSS